MKKLSKTKLAVGSLLMILVLTILIGCGKDEVLKGKWKVIDSGLVEQREEGNALQDMYYNMYSMVFAKGNTIEFTKDNEVIINGVKASYEFEKDKLTISDGKTDLVFDIQLDEDMRLEINGFGVILEKK